MATVYDLAGTTSHSFTLGDGVTIFYGISEPIDDMGNVGDIYVQLRKEIHNAATVKYLTRADDPASGTNDADNLEEYPTIYERETHQLLEVGTYVKYIGNGQYYIYNGNSDQLDPDPLKSWDIAFSGKDKLGRVYYKETYLDDTDNNKTLLSRWSFIKTYSFDDDIIHAIETGDFTNDFKIALESADNSSSDSSTKENDYSVNHSAYGVTRYATDAEVIPSSADVTTFLNNYKTYDANNFPTIYDSYSPDKFIAETPNQVASNIEIEMKRALKTEGKLNSLTTRTKNDLVSAINELDYDLGTVDSTMTAGTALGGKTISTGNNTDILVADALSTLNTKAGVLTSLTTDEKNTLVGAINEVDSHTDTNTTNIGSITTAMDAGTALAGKTIATGNGNTDIPVANALSTLNAAVKTNSDHIGDLGNLDTAANNLVEAINTEATTRSNADNNLQDQIDAIVSKSDVVDVVSCYDRGSDTSKTDIVHYNTSTLGDNDVIKVLIDETHDNATTYYRWDATTSQFEYIGPEGSYYTKAEADNRFVNVSGDTMTGTLALSSSGAIDATAGSITVPTQAQTVNNTNAASTAYVRTAISNEHDLVVHLADTQTITGNKTFTGTVSLGSSATATTQASNDSSTKVATTAWVNDTNNNVVHKSDTETITGTKTFTQNILRTGAFSSTDLISIKLSDTNNKGSIESDALYASTTVTNRTKTTNTTANKSGYLDLKVTDDGVDGVGELVADGTVSSWINEAASNSTTSKDIAFVGWVNDPAKSTNVVHRTGDETIGGAKTFTGDVSLGSSATATTQASNDSSTKVATTAFVANGLSSKFNTADFHTENGNAGYVLYIKADKTFDWKAIRDITTLEGLTDTTINSSTLADDQSLVYDNGTGKWVNKRPIVATISYW